MNKDILNRFSPELSQITIAAVSGVEIGKKILTGHKFTNLLKSLSPCVTMVHSKGNF